MKFQEAPLADASPGDFICGDGVAASHGDVGTSSSEDAGQMLVIDPRAPLMRSVSYSGLVSSWVVGVGSHIQRIVLATEETTVTQQVSHRSIKCQSRSWS